MGVADAIILNTVNSMSSNIIIASIAVLTSLGQVDDLTSLSDPAHQTTNQVFLIP